MPNEPRYGSRDEAETLLDDVQKKSRSAVSEAIDKAKDTTSDIAGKVSEAADQAQSTATEIAKSATDPLPLPIADA